jgi:hypothetical protein
MFDKRKFLSKRPKYCNRCGEELKASVDFLNHNVHTGKPGNVYVKVFCPSRHYLADHHTCLGWNDNVKNFAGYSRHLPVEGRKELRFY